LLRFSLSIPNFYIACLLDEISPTFATIG
jgi:hypothetical protein